MKADCYERPDYSTFKKLTALRAARAYCIDCCGGVSTGAESPTTCPDSGCPLWRFRMGLTPGTARKKGYEVGDLS